jgi:phosphoglycerol transferase
MFLPESMYFFMISLVFLAVLKASDSYTWKDWALVGVLIGVTSLVKPHAWLSASAIGIFLVVLGITQAKHRFKPLLKAVGAISVGAILGRIVIGFIVAGPRALDFFGVYLNTRIIGQVAEGVSTQAAESTEIVGSSPMNGMIALFGTQLTVHVLTLTALIGIAFIGLVVGMVELIKTRKPSPVTLLSLFMFIWLVSMTIEIIMFTGWITGGGDDHTGRVLSRYYDFLFVFVPLAGLAALSSKFAAETSILIRIPLAGLMLALLTPAFTGFFGSLEIQIADAPNLAGLVVNLGVFNAVAMIGFLGLLVFAFQPKFTPWVFVLLLPASMVGTGYAIQGEYDRIRGYENAQDIAGKYLKQNLTEDAIDATWIIATSRFEATNVAIWADSATVKWDLFAPGGVLDESLVPEGSQYILATGDLSYAGEATETITGDGYILYKLK